MYAELSLTRHALQDSVEKAVGPHARHELVKVMVQEHGVISAPGCRPVRLSRSRSTRQLARVMTAR
jgi:hypothetical protein